MSRPILKVAGVFLIVAGVLFLGLAGYAMYRLGVSEGSSDGASLAKRGIAAALAGSLLFVGGLLTLRSAHPGDDETIL